MKKIQKISEVVFVVVQIVLAFTLCAVSVMEEGSGFLHSLKYGIAFVGSALLMASFTSFYVEIAPMRVVNVLLAMTYIAWYALLPVNNIQINSEVMYVIKIVGLVVYVVAFILSAAKLSSSNAF